MIKEATTKHDLLSVIQRRWSPRTFSDKMVETESLKRIMEAGSWAASSYNEQPWRLIVGRKGLGDTYDKVLACLNEWNQMWAKSAPVIMLIYGKTQFTHNEQANNFYAYDCGAFMANLSLQAIEEDIYLHQMAGVLPDKMRELCDQTDHFEPLAGVALGYLGDIQNLPNEDMKSKEQEPRIRKELEDFVYTEKWGEKADWI